MVIDEMVNCEKDKINHLSSLSKSLISISLEKRDEEEEMVDYHEMVDCETE